VAEKDFQIKTANTIKNMDKNVWKYDIQPWVFFGSVGLIFAGFFFTILAGATAEKLFADVKEWISNYTGWFLVLTMNVVLATCIGIMVSPLGKLRIGGADAEPEFGYLSWFAMLFSAGMIKSSH
jgi:choline-glycine betaine transporter